VAEIEKLPLPGAIGMLCEAPAIGRMRCRALGQVLWGNRLGKPRATILLQDTDPACVGLFRAIPIDYREFSPSLLIVPNGSCAELVGAHPFRLINQGVDAELHVLEGLGHASSWIRFAESREVHQSRSFSIRAWADDSESDDAQGSVENLELEHSHTARAAMRKPLLNCSGTI